MLTIEKTELKREMLETSIEKQRSLIEDFQRRIEACFGGEDLENEEEYDDSGQSSVLEGPDETEMLNEALNFAKEEMNLLLQLRSTENVIHDRAELGAAVITDRESFYISTSIEEFKVKGEPYIGLSTQSPFFLAMQGKKAGDKFTYNGITYHIMDIF